jgi:glycosyltransferase involved in cell wall biosynthesis
VVNEAMCFGLPVVASSGVAAAADLVRPGENGYLFEPGRVDELADCIERLVVDPDRRRAFGRRSREIIEGWSYRQTASGILAALAAATGRPVSGAGCISAVPRRAKDFSADGEGDFVQRGGGP